MEVSLCNEARVVCWLVGRKQLGQHVDALSAVRQAQVSEQLIVVMNLLTREGRTSRRSQEESRGGLRSKTLCTNDRNP